MHHEWSNHINIHIITKFVNLSVKGRLRHIDHVGTAGQLADIMTKELTRVKLMEVCCRLNVIQCSEIKGGEILL